MGRRWVTVAAAAVAVLLLVLVFVHLHSTTAKTTPHATSTPTPIQNAVGVTFNGCGSATYAEPTPPQPTPLAPSATRNPHPSSLKPPAWTPPPPADNDFLSFVHQSLTHTPSVSNQTVTCGIKHFAAADLANYLHGTSVSGDVVVVAAHTQPSGGGIGQDRVFLLTSTRPLDVYIIDVYSADLVPDVFKGI
jgi:hypothetical protein